MQPDDANAPISGDQLYQVLSGTTAPPISNQFPELGSRISIQHRPRGSFQFVRDAAVYILRLRAPSPTTPIQSITTQVAAELSAHMDVLIANPASRLLLTARVSPAPGTVDVETEASARLRDLSLLQLMNGREAEADEVLDVLNAVRGAEGGLVLTNELRSRTSPVVAFEVRYQMYGDLQAHQNV